MLVMQNIPHAVAFGTWDSSGFHYDSYSSDHHFDTVGLSEIYPFVSYFGTEIIGQAEFHSGSYLPIYFEAYLGLVEILDLRSTRETFGFWNQLVDLEYRESYLHNSDQSTFITFDYTTDFNIMNDNPPTRHFYRFEDGHPTLPLLNEMPFCNSSFSSVPLVQKKIYSPDTSRELVQYKRNFNIA